MRVLGMEVKSYDGGSQRGRAQYDVRPGAKALLNDHLAFGSTRLIQI